MYQYDQYSTGKPPLLQTPTPAAPGGANSPLYQAKDYFATRCQWRQFPGWEKLRVSPSPPSSFFPKDSFVRDLRDDGDIGETEPVRISPQSTLQGQRPVRNLHPLLLSPNTFPSLLVCPTITPYPQPAPSPLSGPFPHPPPFNFSPLPLQRAMISPEGRETAGQAVPHPHFRFLLQLCPLSSAPTLFPCLWAAKTR